eukprot:Opistho-2@5178
MVAARRTGRKGAAYNAPAATTGGAYPTSRRSVMSKWLLSAAAVFALVGFASAEDKKDEKKADVVVKIVHVDSSKVLGVADDSDEAAAKCVLVKDEDGKDARQWRIVPMYSALI